MAHKWAHWLHHPRCLGVAKASVQGTKWKAAHKWANWLHRICRLARPQCFNAWDKIRSGPQVGRLVRLSAPSTDLGGPQYFPVMEPDTSIHVSKSALAHK